MDNEKNAKSQAKTDEAVFNALTKLVLIGAAKYEQAIDDYMQLQQERIKTQQLKQRLLEMALDPEQSNNLKRQGIILQL